MESGIASLSSPRPLRLFVLVAFVLALITAALPAPGASAGNVSEEGSALTYQVYVCPIDYTGTEYLADCTAGPDPIGLTLYGNAGQIDRSGATDENGFLTFVNIPAGTVTASLDVPGDFARFYYACFALDPASGNQIFQFDGTGNQLTQTPSGAPGSALLCRWYVTPESQGGPSPDPAGTGTAQVQVYICPTYYAGDDFLTDCAPSTTFAIPVDLNPGTTYDPANTVTSYTDATGTAAFYGLDAGDYTLAVGVPGDFASFYYACFDTTSGSESYLFDGDLNLITFGLADGGDFSCRFYVIPEDGRGPSPAPSQTEPDPDIGSIDIQVYVCPVGYAGDEYLSDCSPTVTPIGVLLSPSVPFDSDDFFAAETVAEGRVWFNGLEADGYSVAIDVPGDFADFYHACFDVTSGSEVFLFAGDLNTASFDLADIFAVSCRFYVIPEDLRGESAAPSAAPSVTPSTRPTATPRASSSPTAINVLPSTGTGPDSGDPGQGIALAIVAIVAVAGAGLATRRLATPRR